MSALRKSFADGLLVSTLVATRSAEEIWQLAQALARAATVKEQEAAETNRAGA